MINLISVFFVISIFLSLNNISLNRGYDVLYHRNLKYFKKILRKRTLISEWKNLLVFAIISIGLSFNSPHLIFFFLYSSYCAINYTFIRYSNLKVVMYATIIPLSVSLLFNNFILIFILSFTFYLFISQAKSDKRNSYRKIQIFTVWNEVYYKYLVAFNVIISIFCFSLSLLFESVLGLSTMMTATSIIFFKVIEFETTVDRISDNVLVFKQRLNLSRLRHRKPSTEILSEKAFVQLIVILVFAVVYLLYLFFIQNSLIDILIILLILSFSILLIFDKMLYNTLSDISILYSNKILKQIYINIPSMLLFTFISFIEIEKLQIEIGIDKAIKIKLFGLLILILFNLQLIKRLLKFEYYVNKQNKTLL